MMYYLESDPEVAVPPGRLAQMLEDGDLEMERVRWQGSEEWLDAEAVAGPLLDEKIDREVDAQLRKERGRMKAAPRVRTRPLWMASAALFLLGVLVALFGIWWAGLLLMVVAAILDRPRWICGMCGDRVEKTAMLCRTCGARLVRK